MILDSPSLLITDDDRDFRETLAEVFASRGFHTLLAEDGHHALQIVEREQIHVALLDMHMPRMSGIETIRRVKAVRSVVPCLLISAELDDKLTEAARQAEVFSSHSKPIKVSEITQSVREAMKLTYDWPAA